MLCTQEHLVYAYTILGLATELGRNRDISQVLVIMFTFRGPWDQFSYFRWRIPEFLVSKYDAIVKPPSLGAQIPESIRRVGQDEEAAGDSTIPTCSERIATSSTRTLLLTFFEAVHRVSAAPFAFMYGRRVWLFHHKSSRWATRSIYHLYVLTSSWMHVKYQWQSFTHVPLHWPLGDSGTK
jgi:hypothetical protein